jgi:hypothetical protein
MTQINPLLKPTVDKLHKKGDIFTITGQHLMLIERYDFVWDFSEFGAVQVDPKRPYGNSDVWRDICVILGLEEPEIIDDICDYLTELHDGAAMALAICTSLLKFETGTYIYNGRKWQKGETQ